MPSLTSPASRAGGDPRAGPDAPGQQQAPHWLGSQTAPPSARRVLPSLFDRLCAPPRRPAPSLREQREQLRACVLRDLQSLLNTPNHEHLLDPLADVAAAGSCWNYGAWAPAGVFLGRDTWQRIAAGIRRAIERFEPRIVAGSLNVLPLQDPPGRPRHNLLRFAIDGLIHDLPQALAFRVQSTLDLETRHLRLDVPGSPVAPRRGPMEP